MTALAVARFDHAEGFQTAVRRARDSGWRVVGLWSPTPVDVPDWPDAGGRGIPGWMAAAGLGSACLFYLLTWWTAVWAYGFNSGNRPLHSWPTFLIAPVEFGALAAGIAGVVLFFRRARLTRLHDAAFAIPEVGASARDSFVLAIACDAGEDANRVLAMLGEAGAAHSRLDRP